MRIWPRTIMVGAALCVCASAAVALTAVRHLEWFGVLTATDGSTLKGNAGMLVGQNPGTTEVSLVLSGGRAGATHAWSVERGHCDGNGGVVYGSASRYTAARMNASGASEVTVILPVALSDTGSLHVRVRSTAARTSKMAACGNLYLED